MSWRGVKLEMLRNSLNNSDTHHEDAGVVKDDMKIVTVAGVVKDEMTVVTVQPKAGMMFNSLNYPDSDSVKPGSDTEYGDGVSDGESIKSELVVEDRSEANSEPTVVGSVAGVEDVDDATLRAMLRKSTIGMHTEDKFPTEVVRILYVQESSPCETLLQYRRKCGHVLAEEDVLHVYARQWLHERNMAVPVFWFVPLAGQDGVFLSEAMTELYFQDTPQQYGYGWRIASSSKRPTDDAEQSRKVRRLSASGS